MYEISIIEKMDLNLDGKIFKFFETKNPRFELNENKEKVLIITIGMVNMNSGDIVSEIDFPVTDFKKNDKYIILAEYRKKLIDQYKKTMKIK